ncbi:MAG TPA: HipA domain-containing protein [Arachidicoccus soli]|nr:HipA domain-containing protein [Arachidicoccus soli]
MICSGCYIKTTKPFCPRCRRKLFDGTNVPSVLSFDAPKADNLVIFQKNTKRLSISGVQLKYSLRLEENELVLTEKNGQYILKPIPPSRQLIAVEDVPENEHLTMQIADQLFKINTAANGIVRFRDGEPAYITRRFDVKPDGSKYMQEDFAQLLSRTSDTHGETFKYEGTYEEIGLLIKQFVAAAPPALENFFKLVVFNYVISNGDAHLKNFSLIRTDNGEYQLAPAYDLMSTILHTPHESDTALDLYAESLDSSYYSEYGCYGRPDFLELAKKLGLIEKRSIKILDDFIFKEGEVTEFVEKSLLSDSGKQAYIHNLRDKVHRLL